MVANKDSIKISDAFILLPLKPLHLTPDPHIHSSRQTDEIEVEASAREQTPKEGR